MYSLDLTCKDTNDEGTGANGERVEMKRVNCSDRIQKSFEGVEGVKKDQQFLKSSNNSVKIMPIILVRKTR